MKPQKLTTSKLFYKKWPFKIECHCPGSYMLKRQGFGHTMAYCLSQKEDTWRKPKIDKVTLKDFAESLEPFLNKDLQFRAEGSTFNIYCADYDLYKSISQRLKNYVVKLYEPGSKLESDYMVDNNAKKILCNHIPFNQFNYRVFIKTGTPLDVREKFESWISKYTTIKAPKHVISWLSSGARWGTMPFVYVQDSSTLSMIGLFLGGYVLRVEQFIPRSSINIPITQEETCQV